MRAFIAYAKKEFSESVRTYKLLIIVSVFLIFGLLNPIVAKIMPEILSSMMPEGITITLAEPSAIDSWMQFYKNISTQLIIFVIVYCGSISNELSKGTLINMLTKGLPRKTVILAKFTAISAVWTLGYIICFVTTYGYTLYLLPGKLSHLFSAAVFMWLYGVMIISAMLFGGTLFGSFYGALLVTGGFSTLLMVFNIFPKIQKWIPYRLSTDNLLLITEKLSVNDFYLNSFLACALTIVFIVSAMLVFNKKKL